MFAALDFEKLDFLDYINIRCLLSYFNGSKEREEYIREMFGVLMICACSETDSLYLYLLQGISSCLNELRNHTRALSIPQQCFVNGRLRGAALYVIADFLDHLKFPEGHSQQTFLELLTIPKISEDREFFAANSAFNRFFFNPKTAFNFALTKSEPNLVAIENIFRLFKAEDGSFSLLSRRANRSVNVRLSDCGREIIVEIETGEGQPKVTKVYNLN